MAGAAADETGGVMPVFKVGMMLPPRGFLVNGLQHGQRPSSLGASYELSLLDKDIDGAGARKLSALGQTAAAPRSFSSSGAPGIQSPAELCQCR